MYFILYTKREIRLSLFADLDVMRQDLPIDDVFAFVAVQVFLRES